MRLLGLGRRALRRDAAAASFRGVKQGLAPPLAALLTLSLDACSQPAPPADNAPALAGDPSATRAVMIGTEGPSLPACSSRSEEHTSEPQSLMRRSYAVFCLTKKTIS